MNSACLRENPSLLQRAKVAYDVAAEKEQAKPGKGKGKGKGDGKSDKGARVRRSVLHSFRHRAFARLQAISNGVRSVSGTALGSRTAAGATSSPGDAELRRVTCFAACLNIVVPCFRLQRGSAPNGQNDERVPRTPPSSPIRRATSEPVAPQTVAVPQSDPVGSEVDRMLQLLRSNS